jgi:hypothetical protein
MVASVRVFLLLLVGAGLLLSALYLHPAWLEGVVPGLKPLAASGNAQDQEQERGERYDAEIRAIGQRLAIQENIGRELLEGRLTLSQAARQLRDLVASRPVWTPPSHLSKREEALLEGEIFHQHAIDWAENVWTKSSRTDRSPIASLEAELQRLRERDDIILPPIAARP